MKKYYLCCCCVLLYYIWVKRPEWVNLIAQQEQEGQEEKREEADSGSGGPNLAKRLAIGAHDKRFMNKPENALGICTNEA